MYVLIILFANVHYPLWVKYLAFLCDNSPLIILQLFFAEKRLPAVAGAMRVVMVNQK